MNARCSGIQPLGWNLWCQTETVPIIESSEESRVDQDMEVSTEPKDLSVELSVGERIESIVEPVVRVKSPTEQMAIDELVAEAADRESSGWKFVSTRSERSHRSSSTNQSNGIIADNQNNRKHNRNHSSANFSSLTPIRERKSSDRDAHRHRSQERSGSKSQSSTVALVIGMKATPMTKPETIVIEEKVPHSKITETKTIDQIRYKIYCVQCSKIV